MVEALVALLVLVVTAAAVADELELVEVVLDTTASVEQEMVSGRLVTPFVEQRSWAKVIVVA